MIQLIFIVIVIFLSYLILSNLYSGWFTHEPFTTENMCKYLQKQKKTPLGDFEYSISATKNDTCQSLKRQFGTPYVYGENNQLCDSANTKPLHKDNVKQVQVLPNVGCIFHTPVYSTSCGELATLYNTIPENIMFKTKKKDLTRPKQCTTSLEHIPHGSLTQICLDTKKAKSSIIDNPTESNNYSVDACKQACTSSPECKSILYGNNECTLFNTTVPLQNIDQDDTIQKNMFSCLSSEPLTYAGATNKLFDYQLSCTDDAFCKSLGSTICSEQCLGPYTNQLPYNDNSIQNAWGQIIENVIGEPVETKNTNTKQYFNTQLNNALQSENINAEDKNRYKTFYKNLF